MTQKQDVFGLTKAIVFLQDNEFKGFVEAAGAEEIKRSAVAAGYQVEDSGVFFNVLYNKGKVENK